MNKFKPHLLNLFLSSYLQQGEIEKALNVADQIIALQPETDLLVEVLYTRGQIYRYGLGDQRKAAQIFQSLITEYPTHPTANSARAELESMELSRKILTELDSKENIPQKLTLRNYPNPFAKGIPMGQSRYNHFLFSSPYRTCDLENLRHSGSRSDYSGE